MTGPFRIIQPCVCGLPIYADPDADDGWLHAEPYDGEAAGAHIAQPEAERRYRPGCDYCQREKARGNTFFPPHDALPTCRSGGRNHCTCDACF